MNPLVSPVDLESDALILQTAQLLARAHQAAFILAAASTQQKNAFLLQIAVLLRENTDVIVAANAIDILAAVQMGRGLAFMDRLRLDPKSLSNLADAVKDIASLPDPIGQITSGSRRPNGLQVQKVRAALGVIGIIYESRPNVTIDAAALCVKAGNAVVLRGGSEARHSNAALIDVLRNALAAVDLPPDAVQAPQSQARAGVEALVSQVKGGLDLVIPRGGTALIDTVNRAARVPVIQHYQGVCHLFVHAAADLELAIAVIVNAKAQRPGVCNAVEAILVDDAIAPKAVPAIAQALRAANVQVRADSQARALAPDDTIAAHQDDYGTEFLDYIALLCVVDGYDGAVAHIRRYGSHHTEGILTQDIAVAQRFAAEVDASCIAINASTRFNDGGCLGLGAEIGISTSKLHAYGPMGLESLTCEKYVITGTGHIRT